MVNGGSSDSMKLDAPMPEATDTEAVGRTADFARALGQADAEQQADFSANAKHGVNLGIAPGPNKAKVKAGAGVD